MTMNRGFESVIALLCIVVGLAGLYATSTDLQPHNPYWILLLIVSACLSIPPILYFIFRYDE